MAVTVILTGDIPQSLVDILKSHARVELLPEGRRDFTPDKLIDGLKDADAVICQLTDLMSRDVMSSCPRLALIANVAVGYDNIDVDAATSQGILVTNTPGVLDETTADLAFGLLLACARRIAEGCRFVRSGSWTGFMPDLMLGVDVYGKTLGIVGFGRIGKAVARRALGFGMTVLYTSRTDAGKAPDGDISSCSRVSFDELLSRSDFVSLHCPLTKETDHLVGARALSIIKSGSIVINTARGAVVDQKALIDALKSGKLGGAGLDVFEDEPNVPEALFQMENVVLTPHIGSASVETRTAMALLAVNAVISAFAGELPANAVNPGVWPEFVKRLGLVSQ